MNHHFDDTRPTGFTAQLDASDPNRVKESMRKATIKNTASEVKSRMGEVKALRTTKDAGALDLDAVKEK